MLQAWSIGIIGILILALVVDRLYYRYQRSIKGQLRQTSKLTAQILEVDIEASPICQIDLSPHLLPTALVIDTETIDAITEEDTSQFASPILALSWALLGRDGSLIKEEHHILNWGKATNAEATSIHQITDAERERGEDPRLVYTLFLQDLKRVERIYAHNLAFHLGLVEREFLALNLSTTPIEEREQICTMELGRQLGIKRNWRGESLYPKLGELFSYLYFGILHCRISFRRKDVRDLRLLCLSLPRLRESL